LTETTRGLVLERRPFWPAKTAALEALIEAHAGELKLPTVKARFRAMAAEATRDQQTPIAYLAAPPVQ